MATVDNLVPTLIHVLPAHNAINVMRDQPIILTFSEPIAVETLAWSCQTDPGGWTITTMNNGHTLRLDHNLFEPNRLYSCYLRTAEDQAGHHFNPGAMLNPWGFITQDGILYRTYLPTIVRPNN